MIGASRTWLKWGLVLPALFAVIGCDATEIETAYGRTRGRSVNGTGVFEAMLRQRGHDVRIAGRLTEELGGWAETIVRFSPVPGPIPEDEAQWYLDWQDRRPGRRLIFVCRDGSAEQEYWTAARDALPADAPPAQRDRIDQKIKEADGWGSELPPPGIVPADPELWFGLDQSTGDVSTSEVLEGPWAEGIDPALAALPIHRALEQTSETEWPLLIGDGRILAMEWTWEQSSNLQEASAVLVIANGSFLLNAALVNRERRPLAMKVVDWAGAGQSPRRIAIVEGSHLLDAEVAMPTSWDLIRQIPELGFVAAHFLALALVTALAHSVMLGRPRPSPAPGVDKPRAHAEALGNLLARLGTERAARRYLGSYRRWRRPQAIEVRPEAATDRPEAPESLDL